MKAAGAPNAASNNSQHGSMNDGTTPGEKLDRNYAKKLIEDNIEIISNCFNINAPKSV